MSRSVAFSRVRPRFTLPPIVRCAAVGSVNITVDVSLYALLVTVAGLGVGPSNILSFSIGIFVSFLLNRDWVFAEHDRHAHGSGQLYRFLGLNLIGLALSTALVSVFAIAMDELLAKGLSIIFVFFYNYLCYSRLVFRPSQVKHAPGA